MKLFMPLLRFPHSFTMIYSFWLTGEKWFPREDEKKKKKKIMIFSKLSTETVEKQEKKQGNPLGCLQCLAAKWLKLLKLDIWLVNISDVYILYNIH